MKKRSISLLVALIAAIAPAARAATREVLAHGSADMYWIVRIEQDAKSGQFQSFIQSRQIAGGEGWKLIARLNQRVVSLASHGSQLAVLLETGDWMFVWDGGSSNGAWPEDGSKLIQLAMQPTEAIWAIASAGGGRQPTTAGATQPAASIAAGTRILERMEAGQWTLRSTLPPEAQRGPITLAVFNGVPMIAVWAGDQGPIRALNWVDKSGEWQEAGSIPMAAGRAQLPLQIKLLGDLRALAIWIGNEDGGEFSLMSGNHEWARPVSLDVPSALARGAAKDVAIAGQRIRVVVARDDLATGRAGAAKMLEFAFAPDGSPRGQSTILVASPSADQQPGPSEWLSAVAAALLMMMLLNSMRRRGPLSEEELVEHGLKLAPLGRRLLAGMIDALPLVGTLTVASIQMAPDSSQSADALADAMKYPFYISLAVYIFHTSVSEALWGWTIGKKLCGLRVVMIDGTPHNLRAILVRNLLRVVDVAIFPLLLILLTPLRQRGGDMAAETMVVLADDRNRGERIDRTG